LTVDGRPSKVESRQRTAVDGSWGSACRPCFHAAWPAAAGSGWRVKPGLECLL